MELHLSNIQKDFPYLILDEHERISVLPTNFVNSLVRSPRSLATGTIQLYADRLKSFCNFVENHGVYGQVHIDDAIQSMGIPLLDEFYRSCKLSGLSNSTIRGYEVVLKLFTNWLTTEDAGRVKKNALYENIRYRTPSPLKKMPRYMTVSEVIVLIKSMRWEVQRLNITQKARLISHYLSEVVKGVAGNIKRDIYDYF